MEATAWYATKPMGMAGVGAPSCDRRIPSLATSRAFSTLAFVPAVAQHTLAKNGIGRSMGLEESPG